jgi:hypothetical protein
MGFSHVVAKGYGLEIGLARFNGGKRRGWDASIDD